MASRQTMMVVDDVELNRSILTEIFAPFYTIVEADNGEAAYRYILENHETVGIILLDLVMPVMDGFQLLAKLKSSPETQRIPVVVTSQGEDESEAKALAMGAADFISKPYHPEIAIQRVKNVLAEGRLEKLEKENSLYQKMQAMEHQAKTDSLTGLYNRMELEARVAAVLSKKNDPKSTFIILDIDNFKLINDRLGHTKGDRTLQKVAKLLRSCFRNEDLICRMGGDEFAVFIENAATMAELNQRLMELCKKLRFVVGGLHVTCSVGAACSPEHGKDYQTLYQNADIALLTAKRLGKNQYQIFGGETELPSYVLFRNMDWLLDEASDAVVVCDAKNYDLLYLNDVACKLAKKTKKACMGKKCYEALWDRTAPCTHCANINLLADTYCEHEFHPDGWEKSFILKEKKVDWGGRPARIQYIQDNTNRAAIARQLEEVSADRKRLLDLMPGGVFRYSADEIGGFDFISENMLKILGYTREGFDAKFQNRFENMVWWEDRVRVQEEIRKQIAYGDTDECEYRIEKADGTLCWVHDVGHLVKDAAGVAWFYVTILDITQQHSTQKRLEEEHKKLAVAMEHAGFQYWEHDLKTDICVNGIKGADLGFADVTRNYSDFLQNSGVIPTEYIALYREKQEALYAGAPYVCYDLPLYDPRGKQIWWRVRCTNLFDENGTPVKTIGTAENIDKFKEYEQRYEALAYESDVQTFVLDIQNRCITDNIGVSQQYGYNHTIENVPESLAQSGRIHPEDVEKFCRMYQSIYAGAESSECESRWRTSDRTHWCITRVRLTTVFDRNGKPVKAFGTGKLLDKVEDVKV